MEGIHHLQTKPLYAAHRRPGIRYDATQGGVRLNPFAREHFSVSGDNGD